MFDPLKWPILDSAGNPIFSDSSDTSSNSHNDNIMPPSHPEFFPAAKPLATIPAPPIPRLLQTAPLIVDVPRVSESDSVSSSLGEMLNPDVPEFVPIQINSKPDETHMQVESEELVIEKKAKKEEKVDVDEKKKSPKESKKALVNGEVQPAKDDAWREVKRKVKQHARERTLSNQKADSKGHEKEELDFQFDEELDSPVPAARHNAFSEW